MESTWDWFWLNAVMFPFFCLLCLGTLRLVFLVCETMKDVLREWRE